MLLVYDVFVHFFVANIHFENVQMVDCNGKVYSFEIVSDPENDSCKGIANQFSSQGNHCSISVKKGVNGDELTTCDQQ